jgi:hypothetical protein
MPQWRDHVKKKSAWRRKIIRLQPSADLAAIFSAVYAHFQKANFSVAQEIVGSNDRENCGMA